MEIKLDLKKVLGKAMENIELEIGMTLKEAVEKQIPKQPVMRYLDDLDIGNMFESCPICGSLEVYEENPYCPKCGQRLKWGE